MRTHRLPILLVLAASAVMVSAAAPPASTDPKSRGQGRTEPSFSGTAEVVSVEVPVNVVDRDGKPVPGLAFFVLSLVSIQQRRSFPLRVEQVVRSDAEKAARKAKAEAKKQKPSTDKRPRGRPKGSKNPNKADVLLTPE